jgi:hypothetical protein
MSDPVSIGAVLAAVGALGSASFALVDAAKLGRKGGVSNAGFAFVEKAVGQFLPAGSPLPAIVDANLRLLSMLHGLWINGAPLLHQKAVAKSLIKLRLAAHTAPGYAAATGNDPQQLLQAAACMAAGSDFSDAQSNALGRFDVELSAILDEAYQRADQRYRNVTKVLALCLSVLLAIGGNWAIAGAGPAYFNTETMWRAVLCGILAGPMAPIAKDAAGALAEGARLLQALRR